MLVFYLHLGELEDLAELQPKVKKVRVAEGLGEQSSHQDIKESCEPITETVETSSGKVLEVSKATFTAIEDVKISFPQLILLKLYITNTKVN